MCTHPGIHKVETNFMTGTVTVYHDESVTLAEIKQSSADGAEFQGTIAVPDGLSVAVIVIFGLATFCW
jgi:copper chaperone CopZ